MKNDIRRQNLESSQPNFNPDTPFGQNFAAEIKISNDHSKALVKHEILGVLFKYHCNNTFAFNTAQTQKVTASSNDNSSYVMSLSYCIS